MAAPTELTATGSVPSAMLDRAHALAPARPARLDNVLFVSPPDFSIPPALRSGTTERAKLDIGGHATSRCASMRSCSDAVVRTQRLGDHRRPTSLSANCRSRLRYSLRLPPTRFKALAASRPVISTSLWNPVLRPQPTPLLHGEARHRWPLR